MKLQRIVLGDHSVPNTSFKIRPCMRNVNPRLFLPRQNLFVLVEQPFLSFSLSEGPMLPPFTLLHRTSASMRESNKPGSVLMLSVLRKMRNKEMICNSPQIH